MRPEPKITTAKTLLYAYLDAAPYIKGSASLDEEQFSRSPLILYQFRRFMAIFRAFEIPCDPRSFHKGEFIEWESSKYAPLLEKMAVGMDPKWVRAGQLPTCYEFLMEYRIRVESVFSFTNRVIEAGGLFYFAYMTADNLDRIIRKNVETIDDLLAEMIDPDGKEFTIEELKRNHGYPEATGDTSDW